MSFIAFTKFMVSCLLDCLSPVPHYAPSSVKAELGPSCSRVLLRHEAKYSRSSPNGIDRFCGFKQNGM